MKALLLLLAAMLVGTGCVQRKLSVTSDPPGALVYMNDQEVGRTPFVRDFTWYGKYDVAVRKEGYEPLKTETDVTAPWWQWFPIDLFTEVLPLTDRHALSYTLKPATTRPADTEAVITRAAELQQQLQSPKK